MSDRPSAGLGRLDAAASDRPRSQRELEQPGSWGEDGLPPGAGASGLADDGEALPLTDLGLAQRLIRHHGKDLRYLIEDGVWLVWNGQMWERDVGELLARGKAQDLVRNGLAEEAGALRLAERHEQAEVERMDKLVEQKNKEDASYAESAEQAGKQRGKLKRAKAIREAFGKFAKQAESSRRISATLAEARALPGVAVRREDCDADPYLLCVGNGVIDLRSGQLLAFERSRLITKQCPAHYDPAARSPALDAVIGHLSRGPDGQASASLASYWQVAVGSSLYGKRWEDAVFICSGPGGTGKTSLLVGLKNMMGGYAKTLSIDSLSPNRRGSIRDDLADLAGARLVLVEETDEGTRLSEGLVKALTGGGTIPARHLYGSNFEFDANFALWLVCNDLPFVRPDDDGTWRRIQHLRVFHALAPEQRVVGAREDLRDPLAGGKALLAWAVRGAMEYWERRGEHGRGLVPPALVAASTEAYREELDHLPSWWALRLAFDAHGEISQADLRADYLDWCKTEVGIDRPLSGKLVGKRLRDQGCHVATRWNGETKKPEKVWRGVRKVWATDPVALGGPDEPRGLSRISPNPHAASPPLTALPHLTTSAGTFPREVFPSSDSEKDKGTGKNEVRSGNGVGPAPAKPALPSAPPPGPDGYQPPWRDAGEVPSW